MFREDMARFLEVTMTEAGEKWASQVAELHAVDVEQVLRAFCATLEERDKEHPSSENWDFEDAFYELKQELLG